MARGYYPFDWGDGKEIVGEYGERPERRSGGVPGRTPPYGLLLGIDEAPNLIALAALGFDATHMLIVERHAGFTGIY